MDRFTYDIFKFCWEGGLIEDGDGVVISLSGGIDSMSLFRLLLDFREKIELKLHLVHFNHGLRRESEDEERFMISLAEERSVPLKVFRANHLTKKSGMQNKAREWRYEHLLETLEETGFNKIALGHQLDDLAETQIWKILRGASLFSLNPLQAKNPPYIRPLLFTPKKRLEKYLLDIKQEWLQDQSNYSNDYTRNLIRNKLVPIMRECSGGRLEEKFLALNRDAEKLRRMFDQMVAPETYRNDHLKYEDIAELPSLMACELINRFLIHHDQPEINRAHIELACAMAKRNQGGWSVSLKNNRKLVGKSKKITLVAEDKENMAKS